MALIILNPLFKMAEDSSSLGIRAYQIPERKVRLLLSMTSFIYLESTSMWLVNSFIFLKAPNSVVD